MSGTEEYFYDSDNKKCMILEKECIFVAEGEEPNCDICYTPEEYEDFEKWKAEQLEEDESYNMLD